VTRAIPGIGQLSTVGEERSATSLARWRHHVRTRAVQQFHRVSGKIRFDRGERLFVVNQLALDQPVQVRHQLIKFRSRLVHSARRNMHLGIFFLKRRLRLVGQRVPQEAELRLTMLNQVQRKTKGLFEFCY